MVSNWDDTEVARPWLTLCPKQKDEDGNALPPADLELNTIWNDQMMVAQIRQRLSDIFLGDAAAVSAHRSVCESGRQGHREVL